MILKFRAWDIQKKEYIYSNYFENLDSSRQLQWFFNFIKDKDVVIEQFIGMLDNSKKELFVGDICDLDIRRIRGVVRLKWGCFGLKDIKSSSVFTGFDTDFSCVKIIGNIHENVSLLDEKGDCK